MRKNLVLLIVTLFTLSMYGQSTIDYSPVNTVTQVGDTLIMKFQYFKNDGADLNLAQVDFEYNNKLLSFISAESQVTDGVFYARNNWGGYKFNPNSNASEDDMDAQFAWWLTGGDTYSTSADWSIERITVQSASALENGQELAFVGRVPVKVTGAITKGQPVFADNGGVASNTANGPLVGLALESSSNSDEKLIECMLKV